jgi:hypothetical protein
MSNVNAGLHRKTYVAGNMQADLHGLAHYCRGRDFLNRLVFPTGCNREEHDVVLEKRSTCYLTAGVKFQEKE